MGIFSKLISEEKKSEVDNFYELYKGSFRRNEIAAKGELREYLSYMGIK